MSGTTKGMLFSQMVPPTGMEAEFNDWYESEHIPVRLALPGFARATRYRELGAERSYLAIYEIDDMAVLESPGYKAVKTQLSARTSRMLESVSGFTRFTCELRSETGHAGERGRYLAALGLAVPAHERAAFDAWCGSDLIPRLASGRAVLRVRRYSVISGDGGPWTEFVLQELRSPDALDARAPGHWIPASAAWRYEAISAQSRAQSGGD
jgi:hypothetical protein